MSSDASFNLFNWHRNNEGGLWLVEGSEDVEVTRRCNSHPWIKNDSDEDSVSENEDSEEVIDPNSIHRWRDDMVEMRY